MPNLPPGVASMLPQHYVAAAAGLPAAAFAYGLQQPAAAMYGAYGNAATGLEDLAALQRASGLHTLVGAHTAAAAAAAQTAAAATSATAKIVSVKEIPHTQKHQPSVHL